MSGEIQVTLGAKTTIGLDAEDKVFIQTIEPWATSPKRITIEQPGSTTLKALKEAIERLEVHVK